MTPPLHATPPAYAPHDPSQTLLYQVVADHLETLLASLDADPDARSLPAYVEREFYDYLQCGVLAHGFLRLGCDTCHHLNSPAPWRPPCSSASPLVSGRASRCGV